MGYSLHVPMPGGVLKIKSRSRLRSREFNREVPIFDFFGVCFVWEPRKPDAPRADL